MIYKSKISVGLVMFLIVFVGGPGILMVYHSIWIGLLVVLFTSAFIIHSMLTTYYRIENNTFFIKSGFFINQTIAIEDIRKVRETNSVISSPAMSLDRLEIFYNKFDSVIVSPKGKKQFIEHIKALNPAVEIEFKA